MADEVCSISVAITAVILDFLTNDFFFNTLQSDQSPEPRTGQRWARNWRTRVNGWMDVWIDGWIVGWVDRQIDGWVIDG